MGSVGGADSRGRGGRANAAAKADAAAKTVAAAKAEKAKAAEARKSSQAQDRFKDTFEAQKTNPLGNLLKDIFAPDERSQPALIAAAQDFRRNANDLVQANVKNADGYFHCKANFEATSRGVAGAAVAVALSVGREVYQEAVDPNNTVKDSLADMAANVSGMAGAVTNAVTAAISGQHTTAKDACADFRPDGLPDKY